jgi:hypothetical protein
VATKASTCPIGSKSRPVNSTCSDGGFGDRFAAVAQHGRQPASACKTLGGSLGHLVLLEARDVFSGLLG